MSHSHIQFYAVHVDSESRLRGVHYVPFSDEEIAKLKQEYNEDMALYGTTDFVFLHEYMAQYLLDKFPYDWQKDNDFSVWIDSFEPVNMDAIFNTPILPREVDVDITIGEDECLQFSLSEAKEVINKEKDKYDGSIITPHEELPNSPRIQIHRFCRDFPQLTNTLHIDRLGLLNMDLSGHIESIEHDDNVTIYHCRNSLFMFQVVVTWHMIYWHDGKTPIYKY